MSDFENDLAARAFRATGKQLVRIPSESCSGERAQLLATLGQPVKGGRPVPRDEVLQAYAFVVNTLVSEKPSEIDRGRPRTLFTGAPGSGCISS